MATVGQVLKEKFLKKYQLSQSDLARAIDVPKTRISQILQNKRMITPDTDLRLCRYFGIEEGFFLQLQMMSDLKKTKKNLHTTLSKIQPYSTIEGTPSFGKMQAVHRVALICGGPSMERGISLNSARSVMDHLSRKEVQITPYYVDMHKRFYRLQSSSLYSNTPADFDFKLDQIGELLSEEDFVGELIEKDIVFPVIHGPYGEDGQLQSFLESHQIPFIGSSSISCHRCFDKHTASSFLKRFGFSTLPSDVLRKGSLTIKQQILDFFSTNTCSRVIVKPIYGGSSIGVQSASSPDEAYAKVQNFFNTSEADELLLEPFCHGKEFTIIVLQNPDHTPVALIPTEIVVNYENGGFFDYRRKYLPTTNTHWFCPPRFEDSVIKKIRSDAEKLFTLFQMRDFARIDGWVLDNGQLLFTDFNPISGMEQNSFIFQQTSRIGLTHGDLLWNILKNGLHREKIPLLEAPPSTSLPKQSVHVLFGGKTAERQVSLMSGTNVWLKLSRSEIFTPKPFLLDIHGDVWQLPYTYALNHTVEEIYEHCLHSEKMTSRLEIFIEDIKQKLSYFPKEYLLHSEKPVRYSFSEFVQMSKTSNSVVFLALHGGAGEDGTLQKILTEAKIPFNGSNAQTSALCMDKFLTGKTVEAIGNLFIQTIPKKKISLTALAAIDINSFFLSLQRELKSKKFIIKPAADGCSAGIATINTPEDLVLFCSFAKCAASSIPPNTFSNQSRPIEMPSVYTEDWIIESFIETDAISVKNNMLEYHKKTGIIELTVGVIEHGGIYSALKPSITVAEENILSVEEKFQGGTGINITPPWPSIIPVDECLIIQRSIEKVAKALCIENYARIDIFYDTGTKIVYVIEANTLPGLTPATVLYHQALAENPPIPPKTFLEKIILSRMKNG